jgi:hypothetical protein
VVSGELAEASSENSRVLCEYGLLGVLHHLIQLAASIRPDRLPRSKSRGGSRTSSLPPAAAMRRSARQTLQPSHWVVGLAKEAVACAACAVCTDPPELTRADAAQQDQRHASLTSARRSELGRLGTLPPLVSFFPQNSTARSVTVSAQDLAVARATAMALSKLSADPVNAAQLRDEGAVDHLLSLCGLSPSPPGKLTAPSEADQALQLAAATAVRNIRRHHIAAIETAHALAQPPAVPIFVSAPSSGPATASGLYTPVGAFSPIPTPVGERASSRSRRQSVSRGPLTPVPEPLFPPEEDLAPPTLTPRDKQVRGQMFKEMKTEVVRRASLSLPPGATLDLVNRSVVVPSRQPSADDLTLPPVNEDSKPDSARSSSSVPPSPESPKPASPQPAHVTPVITAASLQSTKPAMISSHGSIPAVAPPLATQPSAAGSPVSSLRDVSEMTVQPVPSKPNGPAAAVPSTTATSATPSSTTAAPSEAPVPKTEPSSPIVDTNAQTTFVTAIQ